VVTKEFAVKIDTELSELHNKVWIINSKILAVREDIKFTERSGFYNEEKKKARVEKYLAKIEEFKKELEPIFIRIKELDAIYDQDPWTRAFLVVNNNGHVHSSLNCSTCFPTTRYQWLIQYSNDDEATIVDDAGKDACTICYPSAPAETLNRPSRIVTADKVAKAQAKAEREAKKAERIAKEKANAPTASGEFLIYKEGKWTREIKTERSAITEWYSQYADSQREIVTEYYDGKPHTEESIQHQKDRKAFAGEIAQLICFNLAEKHGIGYEEQEAILIKKYGKRGY
jgi:hypothetical protein